MGQIDIIGIGPGAYDMMTLRAIKALEAADIIIGYHVYTELLKPHFPNKNFLTTPMRKEEERCKMAVEEACKDQRVAFVCSGDAGVFGMAGLIYEFASGHDLVLDVIPGITAATSGAAVLGAPLIPDFAVISLSDWLTPWEAITKRLHNCAEAGMSIVLYNPSSNKRPDYLQKACDILLEVLPEETICGTAMNIGREGECGNIYTLKELRDTKVDMFTTVFIGNTTTKVVDGKMVTPRGYGYERENRE
ncbi:MAG: precorrin-3B C(17)-methyltransferase [Lachnospiraceae bacterium]|nr:precorrin-3B C(17)-methyltransferase [Candidatus Equihabitans merdae]